MMAPSYRLLVEPAAYAERKRLPGDVRQLAKEWIAQLALEPRPDFSETLDTRGLDTPPNVELRRIRFKQWRLIYAVNDVTGWVWIWGLRKRPPYNYDDLASFVEKVDV